MSERIVERAHRDNCAQVGAEALRNQLRGAVDLLRDVATAGVSYDDPHVGYVEVQIDRATWGALATYRGSKAPL